MEKQENIDINKKGFFKKIWYSITKLERYPELAVEGVPKAIIYLLKLVAIIAIVSCIGSLYQLNIVIKNGANYISSNFPDFSYKDGILEVQSEETLTYENENFGKIIVDTKAEDEQQMNNYTNEITDLGEGVVILRDKIIIKSQAVTGTVTYTYSDLLGNMGITEFQKQDVINFVNSSQIINLYLSVFIMMFVYIFIIYLLNILTYVIFVSIFGCIANLITKLRMRYAAIFNMSVYAVTLSTILYIAYIAVNIFINFEIKYFEPMYITVATIYLLASIFMIKADLIKRQNEVIKIEKVQKIEREHAREKNPDEKEKPVEKPEDKNEEKKEKEEKEKDKNSETEPEGENA